MENRPPVWLVHGEVEAQEALRSYLGQRNGAAVHLPKPGDTLDLVTL
jgi:hypothetical protein